jgi:BlaI family transcriptional regulator, penicillinase repressor
MKEFSRMAVKLGHRERQILDALYRLERAGVAEIRAALPDPPTYSTVRAMLRLLEDKGHVQHEQDGIRYVYSAVIDPSKARRSALKHVVSIFFKGSSANAAAALLALPDTRLTAEQKARLMALIERAGTERK